jgi:hypothetical protein
MYLIDNYLKKMFCLEIFSGIKQSLRFVVHFVTLCSEPCLQFLSRMSLVQSEPNAECRLLGCNSTMLPSPPQKTDIWTAMLGRLSRLNSTLAISAERVVFEECRHLGSSLFGFCKNRRSSETSVLTRATRRNIPESGILHSHRSENLKSYRVVFVSENHTRQSSHYP